MTRAVFAGCAYNCAPYLPEVRANIERMGSLFETWKVVVSENSSTDGTRDILTSWDRTEVLVLDHLGAEPARTLRIAAARNAYLDRVRAALADFDLLIMLDCDDVNVEPLDIGAVKAAISFLQQDDSRGAVFANQRGIYYDMWALRHPPRVPGDVWEEALVYAETHGVSDLEAFNQTVRKRMFTLPADTPAIEVQSAFGGLGIYRLGAALAGHYCGERTSGGRRLQVCEHVSFHADLRRNGWKLFIYPALLNWTVKRMSFIPSAPGAC